MARLVLHRKDGSIAVRRIVLNRNGNGTRTFDFRRWVISSLELDLVNASTRFKCHQGTNLSCGGTSLDDGLGATLTAKAVR